MSDTFKPAEPQAEMMPLLEVFDKEHNKIICIDSVEAIIREQRDADMAWLPAHDQKVRREFADKVITTMQIPVEGKRFQPQYRAWKQMVARIRAMAEEVSHGQS